MRKTAIYFWFGYVIPPKERFKLIKDVGFDGTMLWWDDAMVELNGSKAELVEVVRNSGLDIENVHLPYVNANYIWQDSADGEEIATSYRKAVAECAEHGIRTAVMHMSQGDNPPPVNNLGLERMKRLCGLAEERGVALALENVRSAAHLSFILDNIDSPAAGFCYDSGHANCFNGGVELLERYGARLTALHLHDNGGKSDEHLLPGEGNINWDCVMGGLKLSGYAGALSLEVVNLRPKLTPAEEYLRRAYAVACGLAAKLD